MRNLSFVRILNKY